MILSRKRKRDIWNERAEGLGEMMEIKAEEFTDSIAENREGISAEREKFILDETTTPKVLHPDKDD